ncbi:MAG: hypothetical protein H6626_13115 [Pseudobdellovibrionaceae bacterium]|nr:hypothetical protein [Bdellovibrionales bacterium]USN47113.1 MAG: hypothetical protein H6626_13115 [Pseudobdellovibrionaceae bacterium]
MSDIRPFSSLEAHLEQSTEPQRCVVDTQLLIASLYDPSAFYEDVVELTAILGRYGVKVYSNVNIRAEFLDIQRRIFLTEHLMDLLEDQNVKLSRSARSFLQSNIKAWLNRQDEGQKILSDRKLKESRDVFPLVPHSGHIGWVQFCEYALANLEESWGLLEETYSLEYISLREEDKSPLVAGEVTWGNMIQISKKVGISTHDAMILNLFFNCEVEFLISADADVCFGGLVSRSTKPIFAPDGLYKRNFKRYENKKFLRQF